MLTDPPRLARLFADQSVNQIKFVNIIIKWKLPSSVNSGSEMSFVSSYKFQQLYWDLLPQRGWTRTGL